MGYKKHNWMKYGRKKDSAELKIKDEDGRKLDFFRWAISDKKSEKNIGFIIRRKYGIKLSPEIKPEESVNFLNEA